MEHKAIPTKYRNVQFRSRLEARWAAFFDKKYHSWQYEPIDLDGWIPDFIVKMPDAPMGVPQKSLLIEVKPLMLEECAKIAPIGVTDKMERAIGSSSTYFPVLLGAEPSAVWLYSSPRQWGHFPQLFWPYSDDWRTAGGYSQWKSPRKK